MKKPVDLVVINLSKGRIGGNPVVELPYSHFIYHHRF